MASHGNERSGQLTFRDLTSGLSREHFTCTPPLPEPDGTVLIERYWGLIAAKIGLVIPYSQRI